MDKHAELVQKCEALAVLIATGRVQTTQSLYNKMWSDFGKRTVNHGKTPRLLLNK